MWKRWTLPGALVIVSLALLSACQGGQSPSGSTTTSPSPDLTVLLRYRAPSEVVE